MQRFSFSLMLIKGIKYFVVFGLVIVINQATTNYPQLLELTVGGLLVMLLNLLKVKWGISVGRALKLN